MGTRSLGVLTLDLIAKIGGFEQGMDKAERRANKFAKNTAGSVDDVSKSVTALASRIAGPLVAALSVQKLAQYADEWTNLSNRLKLVTESSQELALAQSDVFAIAQETRQSLASSAELYQRIATNADALGLSLADVEGVVKTISQTLVISGASAASASAALVQLGQAFASGTLRGEELNSVMEQAPALARAIADGLGVTIGELRAMGKAGELTSDQVIKALQRMSESVDQSFSETESTIGQAFTKLGNSLIQIVGRFDEATGSSKGFAAAISAVSDEIDRAAEGDGLDDRIKQVERFLEASRNVRDSSGFWNVLGEIGFENNAEAVAKFVTQLRQLRAERELLANQKPVEIPVEFDMAALAAQFEEAGRAVEAYGKKATDAAKKLQDSYAGQIAGYREQIALINATTEAEQARYDTAFGALSGLDSAQKQNLVNLAAELDVLQKRKQLTADFEKQVDQLERQIALSGEIAELEKIRYETSKGSLTELNEEQKKRLEGLAAELDAIDQQKEYVELVKALRTEEEQLADQMRERLALLDQISNISDEERTKVAGRIAGAATSEAPEYAGLDAAVGGPFGELSKIDAAQEELDSWYDTQLTMLEEFRRERADMSATWDAEELALKQEHEEKLASIEQARARAMLAGAADLFGELAGLTKEFAGKQSGIYKTMFIASKLFAIADSTVKINQGIANAASLPWPTNLGAMASVAAATAGIVAAISSVRLSGMAHDGIDSVPADGTWLLQKGERVTTSDTSAKLDRTLDEVRRNQKQSSGGVVVNLHEDRARAGETQEREQDGRQIIDIFVADLMGDGRSQQAIARKFGMRGVGS